MSFQDIIFAFISSFLALFPVFNPIGGSLIVNSIIGDLSKAERKEASRRLVRNCFMIGMGSLLLGHAVMMLFGLAIPVIQVAGGFIICTTAIGLLNDSGSGDSDDLEVKKTKSLKNIQKKLFYPMAFPMTMGAGTISVIFTLMASAAEKEKLVTTLGHYLIIAVAVISLLVILYILLISGQEILGRLGNSGTMMINKLVSFLTFCIGIQIMLDGISKIFHINIL